MQVVIKQYKKREGRDRGYDRDSVIREIGNMLALPIQDNICKYYRVEETGVSVLIYSEYCGQCRRDQYIEDGEGMGEDRARVLARQILMGMDGMHRKGMYHMDLSGKNIMIKDNAKVKIIAFVSVTRENRKRVINTKYTIGIQEC